MTPGGREEGRGEFEEYPGMDSTCLHFRPILVLRPMEAEEGRFTASPAVLLLQLKTTYNKHDALMPYETNKSPRKARRSSAAARQCRGGTTDALSYLPHLPHTPGRSLVCPKRSRSYATACCVVCVSRRLRPQHSLCVFRGSLPEGRLSLRPSFNSCPSIALGFLATRISTR